MHFAGLVLHTDRQMIKSTVVTSSQICVMGAIFNTCSTEFVTVEDTVTLTTDPV